MEGERDGERERDGGREAEESEDMNRYAARPMIPSHIFSFFFFFFFMSFSMKVMDIILI